MTNKRQLAAITFAIGDDDGNGIADVSVSLSLFGSEHPVGALVVNLPLLDARKAATGVASLVGMEAADVAKRVQRVTEALAGLAPSPAVIRTGSSIMAAAAATKPKP